MPELEVKARRVGGATYQVPMEVRPDRRQTLGLRWITKYSRERNEDTMRERLAAEILDALNGVGGEPGRGEIPMSLIAVRRLKNFPYRFIYPLGCRGQISGKVT